MAPEITRPRSTSIVPITVKDEELPGIMAATELGETPMSEDDFAVLAIRNLVCDLCMQNGGGHAGSALGMAAIGVALWKYTMRFNPCDPDWFDRDRFVLSNGHASMFLYIMNYLVGYDAWTIDELKGYGHPKPIGYHTLAHGHPEIQVPGVEVTTGPLGQGIANAVGLAIGSKNLAANFNRPGYTVVNTKIYCMTGDGCLMEGVALEAIALAGHLKLDNLILIYDNNAVTCDGPLDWINTEDINTKMRACGWAVVDVMDGRYDVRKITEALSYATAFQGRPLFVNIRTVIGVDTATAGTAKAHHGAFDLESVRAMKRLAGLDESSRYMVSEETLSFFRRCRVKGQQLQDQWNYAIAVYATYFPDLAIEFTTRRFGKTGDYEEFLESIETAPFDGLATREFNGLVLQKLWGLCPSMMIGGADLINANKIIYSPEDVFHPSVSHKGRYIRHGIREHAMVGIANGLAAYSPGTFLPVTATFFMFYLYAAPAVRMGALSDLQVIHIATHDSFGEGQNGPTHQPVELDSLYRAMPNMLYIRPCDAEEVLGAWSVALSAKHTQSILSLARDPVGNVSGTSRHGVHRGAYIVLELDGGVRIGGERGLTLASCGSELHHVITAAITLNNSHNLHIRVVSAPCLVLFDQQPADYQDFVFPGDGSPVVSVEEYVPTVWAKYATASIGMQGYGYSASNGSNYARFGLDAEGVAERVLWYLAAVVGSGETARVAKWRQI